MITGEEYLERLRRLKVTTEMKANAMAHAKTRESLLRRIPLRRFGNSSGIGPLVVFLASSANDFMTGSIIGMDGGELVK